MNKITKYILGAAISLSSTLGTFAQTSLSFDKEQYQKALWMTTRFYGAQRSGVGPNWLLAEHEPTNVPNALQSNIGKFKKGQSFVKDADGDYDLTGGWFDCGDHVKFGQTEFYSAYMLLLGYSEFPEGYDDYYSFDYTGYISSGDYTWEGKKGVPNGIPDILDEVKYATDYLMKCVRSSSVFYYQVGDGDLDHKHWVTASVMATLSTTEGGEANGSRPVSKASGNVTSMAALCGSALAAMARLYKPFDPEYAQKCLEKALVAYEFVNGTAKGNSSAGGFYGSKPKYVTDIVIFNAELYRTTGDNKYLKAAEENCSWMNEEKDYNYNYSLCYNNTDDLAAYLIASFGSASSYSEKAMKVMDFYVNSMYKPTSGYFLNKQKGAWGVLRFPANQAFVYGLFDKLKGEMSKVNTYSLTTIEYIMGKNSGNMSYITGFGEKSPTYVHHRNYYGDDADKESGVKLQSKYRQFGYLVGGKMDGSYNDVPGADYTYSEGGIDYNAGLVGALGYINSIINPVNVNKFGHPTPTFDGDVSICGMRSVNLNSNVESDGKKVFTWYKDGQKVESSTSASVLNVIEAGEYTCEIDSAGEWTTSGTVQVLDVIPLIDQEQTDFELCDPASLTINVTNGNIPANFVWTRDGDVLKSEKTSSYTITKPGKYECEVSAANCPSVKATFNVTSLLPEVEDATSDISGNVTMSIKSEGDFEWYDVAEGGKPLHTGSTYTTTITEDKLFYIQDAGEMNITVGPKSSSFTSGGVNWGDIALHFDASKACSITGITVCVLGTPYNTGNTTLTAELSGAKKATYTSDAFNVTSSSKTITVTFSNPIEIPDAGSYSLTFKCASFAIPYYESMNNYDSFANQGNPLTFTGAGTFTGAATNNKGFSGIADWQVMTGSGCARAIVKATKGNGVDVKEIGTNVCNAYPNPCKDVLYINLTEKIISSENVTVEFVNLLGSVVKSEEVNVDQLQSGLNVSTLQKGIYIVRIINGESITVKKISKE